MAAKSQNNLEETNLKIGGITLANIKNTLQSYSS